MSIPAYAPDGPPPSCPTAEFIGCIEDVRVWWDPGSHGHVFEYWLHRPYVADVWYGASELDRPTTRPELMPGLLLARAHHLLIPQHRL